MQESIVERRFLGAGRDEFDNSTAGVEYLCAEIHGGHEFGDGAPDEVDQDENGVLVVLNGAAIGY